MPDTLSGLPGLSIAAQEFEAGIFGAPVWRLTLSDTPKRSAVEDLVDAAARGGVALISCRVSAGDDRARVLQAAGFRPMERLVTLDAAIPPGRQDVAEMARQDEAEACARIGASVFMYDRYHADPAIPDAIADEIKRQWVLNGICGRADAALVARVDGAVAGFVLCMRRAETAVIELIGVDRAHQRKGIGRGLVRAALGHYSGLCTTMRVGTQEANVRSIALYRGEGFQRVEVAETYHWTPERPAA